MSATPTHTPTTEKLRLTRDQPGGSILSFDPITFCKCGGYLEVRDHRPHHGDRMTASPEGRYECYCTGCNTCDPNGWSSQAKVIANSPAFFA